jgi:hypothetical protein
MKAPRATTAADDSPEQHPVLVLLLHVEEGEDHQEHEDVVHGQRQLQQPALEELQRLGGAEAVKDEPVEQERQRRPDGGPHRRLLHRHRPDVAVVDAQVQAQEHHDHQREQPPHQG